jgi:class 3 adenylate cyclase
MAAMKRQLVTILYADVAGYSRLSGIDEELTHEKLKVGLDLLSDRIAAHGGKKLHEAGDAILAEFLSVTEAVACGVDFQRGMSQGNSGLVMEERLEFRIGVNLGEVIHDRGEVYGDGVNVAARIQELAEPGGVCVTGPVYEQVHGRSEYRFDDLGHKSLKNIARSVRVYALRSPDLPSAPGRAVFFDQLAATDPAVTGGCLCGELRFEITGKDIGSSYCHCRMCQRFAGAPASAGTGFLNDDFRVTRGEPRIYRSSAIAERDFCPTCGSSLWMRHFGWRWIFIKTANLDTPERFAPTTHFGIESQLPWYDVHDDFPRIRSDESQELSELWEAAGVSASDPPRNTSLLRKPRPAGERANEHVSTAARRRGCARWGSRRWSEPGPASVEGGACRTLETP